jgi:hypothetical protein
MAHWQMPMERTQTLIDRPDPMLAGGIGASRLPTAARLQALAALGAEFKTILHQNVPEIGRAPGRSRGGRAVAGAATNVACAVMLAIVPDRPNPSLTIARVPLKLRRPRSACHAVARVSAIGVRQISDPDGTAKQITRIAAAVCARGL